jgi:hypothetical protein
MIDFKPEYVNLDEINLPSLQEDDIEFYEVEFYPVINVLDGKTGPIALFGKPRTFPAESLYGYNARQLSKEEFFKLFPDTQVFFEQHKNKAA